MNHKTLYIIFLAAAFTASCDKPPTTSQQLDRVREKTAEAAEDMKNYTYAQKAQFTEKMHRQLAAINKDLDQLSDKIKKSTDAAKAEAKPKLQALREKADQLGKQLDDVKNATESTWDRAKATSQKAINDLKDGFNQARRWVSNEIAP